MNLFGHGTAGDGSNTLLRNIGIAGAVVAIAAVIAVSSLDKASRDGTLNRIAGWGVDKDLNRRMANMPRPSNEPGKVIGVRYGNVDYTTTASIPGGKSKMKNVITDPDLGMPQ
jgi:hypothetical protein